MTRSPLPSRLPADPVLGDEIVPGYEVVRLMRAGNRLLTYDVYSRERHCRCILKLVREDRLHEETCRDALLLEGRLARDLSHPHLVRAYEVIEHPRAAIVLETLTGDTLAALIEDAPLSPPDVALLGLQLASALSYLHGQGWLHLDVKPSNIVVQAGRAVLIDFSLVSRPGDGRPYAGTDGYLSPEQARGSGLCSASDVFGFGVTLGEALTGVLPYGLERRWGGGRGSPSLSRSFRRRLVRVPVPLADLVEAALALDSAARPTLTEARSVLQAFAGDEVTS